MKKTFFLAPMLLVLMPSIAMAQTVDVMNTVFSVSTRTPFCSKDGTRDVVGFWLQDVIYDQPDGTKLILRYTTNDKSNIYPPAEGEPPACAPNSQYPPSTSTCVGNMSVYQRSGNMIYVLAEYGILTDANSGEPIVVTNTLQFNPKKIFSPVTVNAGAPAIPTTGTLSWCGPGVVCPPQPITNSWYTYDVRPDTNGVNLWVQENYQQHRPGFPNDLYARTLSHSVTANGEGGSLLSITDWKADNNAGRTYFRFVTANSNGECQ